MHHAPCARTALSCAVLAATMLFTACGGASASPLMSTGTPGTGTLGTITPGTGETASILHRTQARHEGNYGGYEGHRSRERSSGAGAIGLGIGILAPLVIEGIRRERERKRYEEDNPPPRKVNRRQRDDGVTRRRRTNPAPVYIKFPEIAPLPPLQPPGRIVTPAVLGPVPFTAAVLPDLADEQSRPNEIVVLFGPGAGDTAPADVAAQFNLNLVRQTSLGLIDQRIAVYAITDGRGTEGVRAALEGDARALAAQFNHIYRLSAVHKPANTPAQYALDAMHVWNAHQLTRGSGIKVAIIDSMIDAAHPELSEAIVKSYDATGANVARADAHGTAVAGIIGARGDSLGVAPDTQLLAVCAFMTDAANGRQTSSSEIIARAIDWAVAEGAQVLNLSFAGPQDALIAQMLKAANERGVLAVAAAGNNGKNAVPAYPAALDTVIAATATDASALLFTHSNRGDHIDIAAPGVDIFSPAPDGGYQMISGTSMASAHISGLIALVMAATGQAPKLDEAIALLAETARDLGPKGMDPDFGAGLANAGQAVEAGARRHQTSAAR